MLIIWRGAGIAVPILGFASLVGVQLAVDAAGGENYWKENGWPVCVAIGIAALALWFLGRRLNARAPVVQATAADGVRLKHYPAKHTFFYVPMEWWGLAAGVLLVAGMAHDLSKGAA